MLLDNDLAQQHIAHGIEFPAERWNETYDGQLSKGGNWTNEARAMLVPDMVKLLKLHKVLAARQ